jgi:hypothetical protein
MVVGPVHASAGPRRSAPAPRRLPRGSDRRSGCWRARRRRRQRARALRWRRGDDEEARYDLATAVGRRCVADRGEPGAKAQPLAATCDHAARNQRRQGRFGEPERNQAYPGDQQTAARRKRHGGRRVPNGRLSEQRRREHAEHHEADRRVVVDVEDLAQEAGRDGAEEPEHREPAKAARAARMKIGRTSAGTRRRRGRTRTGPSLWTVSGIAHTSAAAGASSARSTQNTTRSGAPAYSASIPASNGPHASPPMLTRVATSVACPRRAGGARSSRVAVAVPVTRPAASPENTRPANRPPTSCANRNTTALSAESAIPGSSTRRLPI